MPSEQAIADWGKLVEDWQKFLNARYTFVTQHRSELLLLIKRAFGTWDDVHFAFDLGEILTVEEWKTLLPQLLSFCSSGRYAGKAKKRILDLPHDWLVENIESAAEQVLSENDHSDWVNILGVYATIDMKIAHRLAQRMRNHSDSEFRAWGEEFFEERGDS